MTAVATAVAAVVLMVPTATKSTTASPSNDALTHTVAQAGVALLDWEGTAALLDWEGRAAALDAWLQSQRELERAATARNVAARAVAAPAQSPSVGACGGATNGADQFIARESGGNPGIWNAGGSGAYGCYQIMPGTWSSSCGDLGAEVGSSAATQAQCASRLPLSAWGA